MFGEDNIFRKKLSMIVVHSSFEILIFFCVMLSAILMALEKPLEDQDMFKYVVFERINWITTAIFVFELIIKVIVFGFAFNGPDSYMKLGWNILDFIIVITSVLSISLEFMIDENHDHSHNH